MGTAIATIGLAGKESQGVTEPHFKGRSTDGLR